MPRSGQLRSRTPDPAVSVAELREAQDRFIAAWGQMGPSWGVSRTMAEVYALLFIVARPLNTDEVMERLSISRGNSSMSLRSLVEWGIVVRVHRRGERKEYFEAEQDPWTLSRKVMRERLRREVHPLLASLFEIRDLTSPPASPHPSSASAQPHAATAPASRTAATDSDGSALVPPDEVAAHNARLDALLELTQTLDRLGERFVGSEGRGLRLAASVLSKIV